MKYSVSCRQPLNFLKTANEIHVDYKDKEMLPNLITSDWVSSADIVIYLSQEDDIDYNFLNKYKEIFKIIIATENAFSIPEIKENGFQCFWSYPASDFWELNGLIDLGVSQILIGGTLFFNLEKVKEICGDIELRVVANQCYNNYMPHENGICGIYIRPEDVDEYEKYISHIEFITDSLEKERTLIKIYKEDKKWPGNLNLLLDRLNMNVDNRGFELLPGYNKKAFALRRMRCLQRCQESTVKCRFCPTVFNLINTIDANSGWLQES